MPRKRDGALSREACSSSPSVARRECFRISALSGCDAFPSQIASENRSNREVKDFHFPVVERLWKRGSASSVLCVSKKFFHPHHRRSNILSATASAKTEWRRREGELSGNNHEHGTWGGA
jgi:hypothetical protein